MVSLKVPESGGIRGFVPETQISGATAAVRHYNALSRVMATLAARCLEKPRLRHFGDFGTITAESALLGAPRAPTALDGSWAGIKK